MRFLNLLRKFKVSTKKPDSTIDAMATMIALHDLEKIVLKSVDKRSLLNNASKDLSIPVDVLIDEISEKMGVMQTKRIDAVDPNLCGGIYSFNKYKDCGAIPLFAEGILTGICGVCPKSCKELALSESVPFYLSDWDRINKALTESFKLISTGSDIKEVASELINSEIELVNKIIKASVNEAKKYKSNKVSIVCTSKGIRYQFKTAEGKFGEGSINSSVIKTFRKVVSRLAKDVMLSSKLIDKGVLFIQDHKPGSNYEDESFPFELIWYEEQKKEETLVGDKVKEQETVVPLFSSYEKSKKHETSKKEQEEDSIKAKNKANTLEKPEIEEQQPITEKSDGKIKIMILEDNPTFARVLVRFLEKDEYEIKHVNNGKDALNSIVDFNPTLIISDVHMPEMNGFSFIKEVKNKKSFKNIPIIMLTSDSDVETEVEFITLGVDAFVSKSSDPRILGAHVKRVLLKKGEMNKRKAA